MKNGSSEEARNVPRCLARMVRDRSGAAYTARMAHTASPSPLAFDAPLLAAHGVLARARASTGWQRTPAHS
jgi:hypothetical protein